MYKFAHYLFLIYFKLFNRFKVTGKENLIENGATIVCANHYSNFDVFLLTVAIKRQIHFMAKKSLFHVPIVKFFVKKFGAFPVDRKANDMGAIKTAMRFLKDGKQIGIFPEGTRVREGDTSDAKGGVVMLTYKCKATLLPVHLKYKRKIHFLNSYEVIIGKPINWNEFGAENGDYKEIGKNLMEHIYEL
ncbi:MAG: 1-acyl-sn-glycerol-3-phosphate acyltransferase [Clostridiales bacterium]|nr:MAG: 1-acyl-sn-glycerol-3-phosphate acyltransferase [Clostridiales bacterium]